MKGDLLNGFDGLWSWGVISEELAKPLEYPVTLAIDLPSGRELGPEHGTPSSRGPSEVKSMPPVATTSTKR